MNMADGEILGDWETTYLLSHCVGMLKQPNSRPKPTKQLIG